MDKLTGAPSAANELRKHYKYLIGPNNRKIKQWIELPTERQIELFEELQVSSFRGRSTQTNKKTGEIKKYRLAFQFWPNVSVICPVCAVFLCADWKSGNLDTHNTDQSLHHYIEFGQRLFECEIQLVTRK